MGKLIKHVKGSGVTIALIVALLFVQAYADLALPGYTADIVNVGITQGGIAEPVPEKMREETLVALSAYMKEGEIETVRAAYGQDEDGLLVLSNEDDETMAALAAIFQVPLSIHSLFGQENVDAERMGELTDSGLMDAEQQEKLAAIMQVAAQMSGDGMEQMDPMAAQQMMANLVEHGIIERDALMELATLPPDMARGRLIRSFADSLFGEGTEMIMGQMSIAGVRSEYEAIGMDMQKVQTSYLVNVGLRMLGMTLLMGAAAVAVGYLAARIAARTAQNLRSRLFMKVVSFSNGDIEKFSTASLITRSTNDIQQVAMGSVMLLRIALYAPILGIGGVLRVMSTNTGLGWIIYVAVGLLLLIVGTLLIVAMPKFNRMQKLVDRLNLISREILTGLPVIRAFGREKHENKRFEEANQTLTKNQLFTSRTMTTMMPLMMLIMNAISVMIIWFGGKGIDAGVMQVGDMMAFINYTMQIVMAFLMLTMLSMMLPRAIVSAERIDEVLNTEPSIDDKKTVRDDAKAKWNGMVAFENVNFRYPDADENVLSGISFVAEPGKTTAIIGSTGSGKSTLLNLIPRFFDVSEGRVTMDGVDIRDLSQHKLRSLLGYVPQKGVLFSGDIASNIKFGGEDITDEAMVMAAEIAQAADFIGEKAEGYHDPIAQGGTNVSGGQKQRLSIARALAKDPPVLLFDDSFSALDYKTDVTLRRELSERTQDKTVIIVAQRISTVLHADQIVVLEEGRIAGIGTHASLMEDCSTYQEIARSQLSEAELKGGQGA